MTGRITANQAKDLHTWLTDVGTLTERRLFPGNRDKARIWVGRWMGHLLDHYANQLTPLQAVQAVPSAIPAPRLHT